MTKKPLHLDICDVLTAHGLNPSVSVGSAKIRISFEGGSMEMNVQTPVVFEPLSEEPTAFAFHRDMMFLSDGESFEKSKWYKGEMKRLRALHIRYCEEIAADRDISEPPPKSIVGFPRKDFLEFWNGLDDTQKRDYLAKYDVDVSREAHVRIAREPQGAANGKNK